MRSSDRIYRVLLAALIACIAVVLALVQFASDGLYARAAAPHALVARVPLAFGLRVYRAIDTIAPAQFVSDALASTALAQGDLGIFGVGCHGRRTHVLRPCLMPLASAP